MIGEDLGTVPVGFRETLDQAGIYGMRVLWFERDHNRFTPPRAWPTDAAAMTSTHDLPSVAGWWRGRDIETRAHLGLVADAEAEKTDRENDRTSLWRAFRRAKAGHGNMPALTDTSIVADAAVKFIAETKSRLALLPLEDALALDEQPNLPGTINEHPNWRRRYPRKAADLLNAPEIRQRLEPLARETAAMSLPRATMRLQFHRGFTFADAVPLVGYFAGLGISHVYASPIMTARPGSMHGYDIDRSDAHQSRARRRGAVLTGWSMRCASMIWVLIVDIVPNHMAVGSGNAWWMDVLAAWPQQPLRKILRHRLGAGQSWLTRQSFVAGTRTTLRRGAGGW